MINKCYDKIIKNSVEWFKNNKKASIIFTHTDIISEHNKHNNYKTPLNVFFDINTESGDFIIKNDSIAVGKPYCSEFIDKFIERYELSKDEKLKVLMVGDDYNSDVKFAENANCDKCLVLSGNTTLQDLTENKINTKNINYIIPDITYLAL